MHLAHSPKLLNVFNRALVFLVCAHIHFQCIIQVNVKFTHTRLMALCLGLPRWASTRKVKLIWILLEQETVSSSGISWAICKSTHRSRQITTPAPHHSVFTGRMPFLLPNQQRQSTEGEIYLKFVKFTSTQKAVNAHASDIFLLYVLHSFGI